MQQEEEDAKKAAAPKMNAMSKKILAQKQKKMEEAQVTQVNLFD